jgi:catechol 2,3-dioxygenase-like lactoylglutathione lyase family enzyme
LKGLMDILGIDNVIFTVGDLNEAVAFYEKLGFPLKFRLDALGICVMTVGFELPGLVLKKSDIPAGSLNPERARFWVEVPDTQKSLVELKELGIALSREPLKLPTGLLIEVADRWGNVVGFTDHLAHPDSGRKAKTKNLNKTALQKKKGKKKKR